uniref:Uncharacterized protein n=1 Tax=Rhizophagus irregularis (strain DAOM 181602 / DAOM 197198 / MUCL 43194) TaxID=747089 RepID=U9T3U0_RHIID
MECLVKEQLVTTQELKTLGEEMEETLDFFNSSGDERDYSRGRLADPFIEETHIQPEEMEDQIICDSESNDERNGEICTLTRPLPSGLSNRTNRTSLPEFLIIVIAIDVRTKFDCLHGNMDSSILFRIFPKDHSEMTTSNVGNIALVNILVDKNTIRMKDVYSSYGKILNVNVLFNVEINGMMLRNIITSKARFTNLCNSNSSGSSVKASLETRC